MKLRVLMRQIHNWSSIVVALPLIIMIGAGVILMLKKEIAWIQPPTERGIAADGPMLALEDLLAAAITAEEAGFQSWEDIDRIDLRPSKGVAKFRGENHWEVQVDTSTGEVIHVAFRRSDIIESIHDGSFFAPWAKLFIFLPAGLVLFGLWLTGLYLFALPHLKKWQKQRAKRAAAVEAAE
ncbi:MAG: PepSY-associated TM helix domain-containing protein [Pseudomonadota bacterium]